jgi:ABC-2 type transport system permease protein
MRKVRIVAWNELQLMLWSKQSWFLLLVLPALLIYLVGLGAQGFARTIPTSIRIDVLDQDNSAASRTFVAALAEVDEALLVCPAPNDPWDTCALRPAPGAGTGSTASEAVAGARLSPDLARERLVDEVAFATITIPEGFAAALEAGDESTLIFQPGSSLAAPEIAFAAVQNAVTRMGGPIVAARLSTRFVESLGVKTGPEFYAARRADAEASWGPPPPVQVMAETTRPNKGQIMGAQLLENGFKLSTPSIAVMFVMISILGLTQSLAEERMVGVLQRVGMMPVSKAQLLGGKLLATYLMGVVQFGVLLAFGELLGVDLGGAPFAVFLVVMAYVLAVTAMALALAALARTPNQARASSTFTWLILVPLGGGWWPLAFVPSWMQTVGHLSPVAWCLDALNALVFFQGTLVDVLLPVGALVVFAALCFIFGVRKLDYQPSMGGDVKVVPYFGIQAETS